jgi:hypothetical protein
MNSLKNIIITCLFYVVIGITAACFYSMQAIKLLYKNRFFHDILRWIVFVACYLVVYYSLKNYPDSLIVKAFICLLLFNVFNPFPRKK